MGKPKVYINRPISPEVEKYISQHCDYELDINTKNELNYSKIKNVEGILTAGTKIDKKVFESAPKLKAVSNMSVGYNNFDIEEMRKRNIIGTHTPTVLENTVADLAFGMMISLARKIPILNNYVKSGNWEDSENEFFYGENVYGSTLGIIGMGRIGSVIAERATHGFNMDVLYHNRTRHKDIESKLNLDYKSLEELLRKSDFVILLIPLNEETKEYIKFEHFQLMKKSAFFINLSRGQTINENDLIRALSNNNIKGAGLDVFHKEPISPDNPLLKLDNTITLPHIGTATYKTRNEIAMLAAQNLINILSGNYKKAHIVKELR